MTDNTNKDEKGPTHRLVEAPKGKGFFLTIQDIYVSSRPYVVLNNSQVQIAANRDCLTILGSTTMSDEDFEKAYREDPAAAIEAAVGKSDDVDEDAVKAAEAKAEEAKAEAARVEEEKAHQAELAANPKAKAKAKA